MLGSLFRNLLTKRNSNIPAMRRLHIGGIEQRDGWEIFNVTPGQGVDHVGCADDLSRFPDGVFHELYASHILEHLDFTEELQRGLTEWHRVLAEDGKLLVSVPDMDVLCKLFLAPQLSLNDRFGIVRMMFGGHVDEHDYHKVGFNFPVLSYFLTQAGFTDITRVDDLGVFNDTSRFVTHGVAISLNVIARKRLSPPAKTEKQQPASQGSALSIEMKDGTHIVVPHNLDLMSPYVLLEQEDWFEDEMGFVRNYLRPGMRVVDVGANYGVYSLSAARKVGETGAVWAIEPGQNAASYLRRSKEVNGFSSLHVVEAALSRTTGSIEFNESAGTESNSLVYQQDKHVSTRKVQAYALDDAVREFGWSAIDFIKLDAEGEELNILDSGARFFADESPLIMYEFKTINEAFNVALVNKFETLGYRTFRLVPGLGVLVPLVPGEKADLFQLNYFCCKADRQAELVARGLLTDPSASQDTPADPSGVLATYWDSLTYAGRYFSRKPWNDAGVLGRDDLIYREGLGLFAHSKRPGALADRVSCLNMALLRVNDAISQRDTLWRNISAARIMLELGARERAAGLLKALSDRMCTGIDATYCEPFLTTSSRYDNSPQDVPLSDFVSLIVNEQLERSRAYSSFFTGESGLVVLKRAGKPELLSMDMVRRMALISRRHHKSYSAQLDARLTAQLPEHRNARLWRTEITPSS